MTVSCALTSSVRRLLSLSAIGVTAGMASWTPAALAASDDPKSGHCPAIFQHEMKQLHSSKVLNLCDVTAGAPVLLVNTASHCGFTGQFGDLEKLHQQHKDAGLVVIGVASDSFNQEADTEKEAADVCFRNFGVSFTMLAPVAVKGDEAHPLFKQVGQESGYPRWNFYKYLIDRDGKIVESWSSFGIPDADDIVRVL